jgi:spermidine/putrescine-binding protein
MELKDSAFLNLLCVLCGFVVRKTPCMNWRITKQIVVVWVFIGLALSGGSRSWGEELRILCWEGYAAPEYTQQFEVLIKAKYGKDVKLVVQNVSDPGEFFEAVRTKKADLISPAHNIPKSARWKLIKGGVTLPLNLANIPNYKDLIPTLQHAEYITEGGEVYGVPIVYGPYGLAYNTTVFAEAPTSWTIFWDPQYRGRYALSADYHEANIYMTALAQGLRSPDIFSYSKLNTPEMQQKLTELAQSAKTFWVGVDTADDLQGLAFATAWGFALPELQKRGEVWKMAEPQEGTTGWVDNWMIGYALADNPALKQIAEEWINYSIGPEVQVGYVRNIAQFPVNLTIGPLLTPEEQTAFHLADPNYFQEHLILWATLGERDQNGFKVMWQRARK